LRLFKKPNGYYYIEFSRGKKKTLKTKNRQIAEKRFKAISDAEVLGTFIRHDPSENITLKEYATQYVAGRASGRAFNTTRIDRESFDKLEGYFGESQIRDIRKSDIEKFIADELISRRKLAPVTINIFIRHMKAAFKKAEKEYIDVSPFDGIEKFKIKDDEPRALTLDEVKAVIEKIPAESTEFREYLYACLYTGGRRTAVANLDWSDIRQYGEDWIIRLRINKGKALTIPLATNLHPILFHRYQRQGPVFPYYQAHPSEASNHFRKYADMAGLFDVKLHSLRHTCATYMILSGIPVRIVQVIMGHSSMKTTEIYTKIAPSYLKGATDVLSF
jgi:integrase